ncbi:Aste57867_17971 [Aphanomyces stellatus]|uniref:Aste57867_17971 protein n=1 Tax=Aphanomyces stellatus TaxID=120398 RepID=A0A485L8U3_9STRA|nr:hypothetical protein As57867_017909 [Aphanomyces stellatus]VFT94711.1 Aste57867_17971 [Aphanomyces stellatus]
MCRSDGPPPPHLIMAAIFCDRDIAALVFSFQDGVYEDVRPLVLALSVESLFYILNITTVRYVTRQDWRNLERLKKLGLWARILQFNAACARWIASLPTLSDVSRLPACLPRMDDALLIHAATTGNIALLDHCLQPRRPDSLAALIALGAASCHDTLVLLVDLAAWTGHVTFVDHVVVAYRPQFHVLFPSSLGGAIVQGHLTTVQYFVAHGCFTGRAIDLAAAHGHLALLSFLHDHDAAATAALDAWDSYCTTIALDEAAGNGHLACVQFLLTHRREGCTAYAMDNASTNGHLDVVVCLIDHGKGGTFSALAGAAANGHNAIVAYLKRNPRFIQS